MLFIVIGLLAAVPPQAARLKGMVIYNRTAPAPQPLAVSRDRSKMCREVPNETLLIHKKGGLQNVLVFIANIKPESLPPLELDLATSACRFQPHVLALGVGGQLTIRNGDPFLQSVHAQLSEFVPGWDKNSTLDIFTKSEKAYFNFAFPKQGDVTVQKMATPGLIRLRSDAGYDWMSGYILVMPHRYFAITNIEGKFELPELPSERYDMVMWHEKLGVKRQIVDVNAKGKNELLIRWFPEETASAVDTMKTN
jgi:hypothetical protein